MRSGSKPLTLSYQLAINNLLLIKGSNSSIYNRLNLVSMALATVRAMLRADINKDEELKARIESLKASLSDLRAEYHPSIEGTYEYSDFNSEQRTDYELKLYEFITELLFEIEENKLINEKTYGEVTATSWTGQDLNTI